MGTSVRITHEPTGATVTVNDGRAPPSQHRMIVAARRMLRGKLWTMQGDQHPPPIVRTYVVPDGEHTIDDLEKGRCIDDMARSFAARARSLDRGAK